MTTVLSATGVTLTFRGGAGIHNVTIEVRPGTIHALVGLNGAGKTTLMKVLLGMLRPTAGQVVLDGNHVAVRRQQVADDLGRLETLLDVEVT